MSINRIVILLSPIFVGLAGWVAELIVRYFPGHPHLDRSGLAAVFIAGVTWAAVHVALWIHGWQRHELRLPNPPSRVAPSREASPPPPAA